MVAVNEAITSWKAENEDVMSSSVGDQQILVDRLLR